MGASMEIDPLALWVSKHGVRPTYRFYVVSMLFVKSGKVFRSWQKMDGCIKSIMSRDMEGLIIILGGSGVCAGLFLLWMTQTKAGQKWVKNL